MFRSWILALWLPTLMSPATVVAMTRLVPSEYATINVALDASAAGDTVLVAAGIYSEYETRQFQASGVFFVSALAFLKGDVSIVSEDGPGATHLDLLGQGDGDFSIPVFGWLFGPGQATLDGFTVTGAPIGNHGLEVIQSGRVTIRNCIFRDLDAGTGPGILGGAVHTDITQLEVFDTQFLNCAGPVGGAIYHTERSIRIERCEFRGCSRGGAVGMSGSIHFPNDTAIVRDCHFEDNHGLGALGGGSFGHEIIEGNSFVGNSSSDGVSAGAVTMGSRVMAEVRNNLFLGNETDGLGGALRWLGGSAVFEGNTLFGNSADLVSAFAINHSTGDVITIRRNIVAGNTGGPAVWGGPERFPTPVSECNDFWANPDGDLLDYFAGPTDLFVDPEFCNPDAGDFTLSSSSPCLPGNSNGCGLIGALGMGCGTVSVTPMSWGRIKNQYRNETNPEGR